MRYAEFWSRSEYKFLHCASIFSQSGINLPHHKSIITMRTHTLIVAASSLLLLSQARKYPKMEVSLVTYNDVDCTQPAEKIDLKPSGMWKDLVKEWGSQCTENLQPGLLPVAYKIVGKKDLKRKVAGQVVFTTDTMCEGEWTGSRLTTGSKL